jgi:hypothetical protein
MVAIVAGAQTAVTPLPDGGWRVEKTGGIEGQYAAAAASAAAITGDFVLRVTDLTAPNSAIFGVSTDPSASDGYADIDFAAQFYGADFYVFENGVYVPPTRAQGGVAWIVRSGGVLRYRIGPTLAGSSVARTVSGVSDPLWFDCTIGRLGGAIGVRFEPPGAWSHGPVRPAARLNIGIGG